MPPRRGSAVWTMALALGVIAASAAARKFPEDLLPRHRQWAEEVDLLLTKEEWKVFLSLGEPYQRDGFIERFWQARDPYPETERNELREVWEARLEFVRESFGNLAEERSRIVLLNDLPHQRLENPCPTLFLPLELWFYEESATALRAFALVFYSPLGQKTPLLWRPTQSVFDLLDATQDLPWLWRGCPLTFDTMQRTGAQASAYGAGLVPPGGSARYDLECILEQIHRCGDDAELIGESLLRIVRLEREHGYDTLILSLQQEPPAREGEWLANFAAHSTELAAGAPVFPASFEAQFAGRQGARTVVQGILTVDPAEAGTIELAGRRSHSFQLTGEVLRDERLFESFRYRYDVAAEELEGAPIPLVFQRLLRPGSFELRLKLEDLHGDRFYRHVEAIEVPKFERPPEPPAPSDPETARILSEANRAFDETQGRLQLVPPPGEMLMGMVRFETLTSGLELAKVTFYLDGEEVMSKRRPPFGIELDLGAVPRLHEVRVVGFDAAGQRIASDALKVNTGRHRFLVQLVEPKPGDVFARSLQARAKVEVPEGERLERLELHLEEELAATLYQPPFAQTLVFGGRDPLYVRAVGVLADGNRAEDTVFLGRSGFTEEIDIQLVELYATVLDGQRRAADRLRAEDFAVFEDGVEQKIVRFDEVRDLPIHAAILFDTSASMEDRLDRARTAAVGFFQQIVTPKDRIAFVTFNDRPDLVVPFTNAVEQLPEKLAPLAAERGTALWDSLIFTLHYFNGIRGQRAVLVLSDGDDESSRHTFRQAREFALTAGVTLYTIGLDLPLGDIDARSRLKRLAETTGGRATFIKDPAELDAVYAQIQEELRSKYLIAYQSNNASRSRDFREIELRVLRPGLTADTLRGYFP